MKMMTMKSDLKPSGSAVRFVSMETEDAKSWQNIKEKYYKGLGVTLEKKVARGFQGN